MRWLIPVFLLLCVMMDLILPSEGCSARSDPCRRSRCCLIVYNFRGRLGTRCARRRIYRNRARCATSRTYCMWDSHCSPAQECRGARRRRWGNCVNRPDPEPTTDPAPILSPTTDPPTTENPTTNPTTAAANLTTEEPTSTVKPITDPPGSTAARITDTPPTTLAPTTDTTPNLITATSDC